MATTADEAVELARRIGFPVAVKLASHQIVHKTEAAASCLNLASPRPSAGPSRSIRERLAKANQAQRMEGVLVQPMIAAASEVMVGVTQDPLFGPLVAFGLGGIHVEILADVCFRVTPLTDRDAAEMVRAIRGYRLLQGYRGHPPADMEAIQEVLCVCPGWWKRFLKFMKWTSNPILAMPPGEGCRIVGCPNRSASREAVNLWRTCESIPCTRRRGREWKGKPMGDGTRPEPGRAMSLEGSTPSPSAAWRARGRAAQAPVFQTGQAGSTPAGHSSVRCSGDEAR